MLRWLLLTMTVLASLAGAPASADPLPAEETVGELDLRGQWG